MKTVKLSLLAVVVATAVSPSAFAGDTVEAATTELTAIQPGMSQSEIDQKIGRFLERTGNSAAAQNYLIAHDYRTTTPQENTAASPVQPTNTLNPITNQAQTDRDNGQDTAIQDAQHAANWASMKADDAQHAIMVAQTDIDANKLLLPMRNRNKRTPSSNKWTISRNKSTRRKKRFPHLAMARPTHIIKRWLTPD